MNVHEGKLQSPQNHPAYIQSVSHTQWNPIFLLSADLSFLLLLINLMDCESKVNDFPLTTEDALAFTIRHRLQSILRTEITASIIGGDTRKTTGTPGGRWLIQIGSFSGGRSERRERRHRITAYSTWKDLKTVVEDRWTSQQVYQYACVYIKKPYFR